MKKTASELGEQPSLKTSIDTDQQAWMHTQVLEDQEVFEGLSPESLFHLADKVEEIIYQPGEYIIKKGEFGDAMYLLIEGEVQIPIVDKKSNELLLITRKRGDLFGEMSLLTGETRSADVIAKTQCVCLHFQRKVVEELLGQHPKIAKFLTTILGSRLKESSEIRKVGKYSVGSEIAQGGMATVYDGYHPVLERTVAIKMLSHELVYHTNFKDLFRNEAKILARLRHPHIVEIFDIEEAYATFFLIMEKLHGPNLEELLERRRTLSYQEVTKIILQLASALDFAHKQKVTHCDLKPSNVMVDPDGNVKLMDFGIALHSQKERELLVEDETFIGTPAYMAPEQIRCLELDERVDIYSLGIMAYRMVSGELPFKGTVEKILSNHMWAPLPSIRELDPLIPESLELFIEKATQKKPEDRFQDCKSILRHFGQDLSSLDFKELEVQTILLEYQPEHESILQAYIEDAQKRSFSLYGLKVYPQYGLRCIPVQIEGEPTTLPTIHQITGNPENRTFSNEDTEPQKSAFASVTFVYYGSIRAKAEPLIKSFCNKLSNHKLDKDTWAVKVLPTGFF